MESQWDYGPDQAEDSGLRQFLSLLDRRWPLILAITASFIIASGLFLGLAPPSYQATATLKVASSSGRDSGGSDIPGLADLLGTNQLRNVQTEVTVINSQPILQGALKRLSVSDQQAVMQDLKTDVAVIGDTDLIGVSVYSRSAQAASNLANAICDEYMDLSRDKNRDHTHGATVYVEKQLEIARDRLDAARTALKDYKESTGIFSLESEASAAAAELGNLQTSLLSTQADLKANNAQMAGMRASAARISKTLIIPGPRTVKAEVVAIQAQMTQLELDRLKMLQVYTPQFYRVKAVDKQLASLRAKLASQSTTEIASSQEQANPLRQALDTNMASTQGQIWEQEARQRAIQVALVDAQKRAAELPAREYRISRLNADVSALQTTYDALHQKREELRIAAAASDAGAQVQFPATQPGGPINANKTRNFILSVVCGLLMGLGVATMADRLDDRVHTETDAETVTRSPILGCVPYIAERDQRMLLGDSTAKGPLLESFRMLRTSMTPLTYPRRARSVVVTSSLPHEGKSLCSANLAIAAAMGGENVILVDCDLRRPVLHTLFGMANEHGFCDVVSGRMTLEEALIETPIKGLRLLTSGIAIEDSFKIINSYAAFECLRAVCSTADFTVVDSPPALFLADAQIISQVTDMSLLVVSCREAKKSEIARTSSLLKQSSSAPTGTLLNKVSSEMGMYGRYYGYQRAYTQLPANEAE